MSSSSINPADDFLSETIIRNFENFNLKGVWGHYNVKHREIDKTTKLNNEYYIKSDISKAAVLIALLVKNGEVYVLLTVRSHTVSLYKGQISLPGGRMESSDKDIVDTALREAEEEVGITSNILCILGCLPNFMVSSPWCHVTSVVALIIDDKFKPKINPKEVTSYFYYPLENLLYSRNISDSVDFFTNYHETVTIFKFLFAVSSETHVIWGLTSFILIFAATVIFRKLPDYKIHLPTYSECINNRCFLNAIYVMDKDRLFLRVHPSVCTDVREIEFTMISKL